LGVGDDLRQAFCIKDIRKIRNILLKDKGYRIFVKRILRVFLNIVVLAPQGIFF